MNKTLAIAFVTVFALAGAACSDVEPSQQAGDTTVTREQPKTPEEIAEQQKLMPKMQEIARKAMASGAEWDSLGAEDKAPFLEFQKGNEKIAKDYFTALVETLRDQDAAQG
jgi:hypothetical protein